LKDPRDFHQNFLNQRIPGAAFWNIDKVADTTVALPHMLPPKDLFESTVRSLGISNDDHVIVYDQTGFYNASARVWWTFKVYGHDNVSVLDGGIQKWVAQKNETQSGPWQPPQASAFSAKFQPQLLVSLEQVTRAISEKIPIVDARPGPRFSGEQEEPRPNLKRGHIPGSMSAPGMSLLKKEKESDPYFSFKSEKELKEYFDNLKLSTGPNDRIITTCGSGVTASTLSLALHLAGNRNYCVYDGSWTEWGASDKDNQTEISK